MQDTTPHPLFVVSRDYLSNRWNNTIVITGGKRKYRDKHDRNGTVFYEHIHYIGGNIQKEWKNCTRRNPFGIDKVEEKVLIIVTPLTNNTLDDGVTLVGREGLVSGYDLDQLYAILLICCSVNDQSLVNWPVDICHQLRSMKPNIVKKNSHFKSGGLCYGFGSAAKYGRYSGNRELTVAPSSSKNNGEYIKY